MLRVQLNAEFIEKLLQIILLHFLFVIFINLRARLVFDFKLVDLVSNIITDMHHFSINPPSAQKSIIRSFFRNVDPKCQINPTLLDRFGHSTGFSWPHKPTESFDSLLQRRFLDKIRGLNIGQSFGKLEGLIVRGWEVEKNGTWIFGDFFLDQFDNQLVGDFFAAIRQFHKLLGGSTDFCHFVLDFFVFLQLP
jgi:hypothetical protein